MNKNQEKNLKAWWEERKKSKDMDALHHRITQAVEDDRFTEPVVVETRPAMSWLSPLGYALAGAAALLVLFGIQRFGAGPDTGEAGGYLALARIPSQELAAGARVFSEAEQLFENRLKWIVESEGHVGMGVDSEPEGRVDETPPAFVRVMVFERSTGEDTWRQAWKTDVMVRGQEMAEIAAVDGGERQLSLWVYPLEDGRLLVDTDLALDNGVRLASRESMLMKDGEPAVLATEQRGDMEYRIIQTVEMLNKTGAS